MNVEPTDLIWMNGDFVAWEDAKVHVLTHGLHYGTGVFEGVRCYDTELGPAVFRNLDHVERLLRSAELYYMPVPYTAEQLRSATLELVARNGLSSCYIRPIIYRGYGQMGLNPLEAPVDVTIACWEWAAYLGEEGKANGIRAKVSSWRRISPDSLIPHAKASGQYLNSVLAKIESLKAGYEEAILLDDHGHVCEGTGENIYIVRDGEIATPGQHNSILDGITRRSIVQIARDLGYNVDYLSRVFHGHWRMSIIDALHQKRIGVARASLNGEPGKNINEIAFECGYTDPGYFRRMFKRLTGLTAREFRTLYARTHINSH